MSDPEEAILDRIEADIAQAKRARDMQRVIVKVRHAGYAGTTKTELRAMFSSRPEDRQRLDRAIENALHYGRIYKDGRRYKINLTADQWDREAGIPLA